MEYLERPNPLMQSTGRERSAADQERYVNKTKVVKIFKNWPLRWKVLVTISSTIAGIISAYYTVRTYHYPPNPPQQINATNSNILTAPVTGNVTQTVNVNEFPEPKLDLKQIKWNSPESGVFKTEFFLTIESKTALKNLYLEARAPSITVFKVIPQRTGTSEVGMEKAPNRS